MKTCPQSDSCYPNSQTTCPNHGVLLNKTCKKNRAGWILALLLAAAVLPALSLQEEGPILLPKPKPVPKPAGPTLLVICDRACNWKLDGEAKGRIEAGGTAKAKVEFGQHIVAAVTLDGLDKVQNEIEIKTPGQMIVHLELQTVREARLNAEQQARDKAEQEVRDKAAREQAAREAQEKAARELQEREQQERERVARELATMTWTDSATGLMWVKKDNGSDVTWRQAMDYCQNLQFAGHSNWRLATIAELQGVYDPNANVDGWRVKGKLQLSGWQWSSSPGTSSGEAWTFNFYGGTLYSNQLSYGNIVNGRALCVRRP